jgi:hypothetical protein
MITHRSKDPTNFAKLSWRTLIGLLLPSAALTPQSPFDFNLLGFT